MTATCVLVYWIYYLIIQIQWTPLNRTTVNRDIRFIGPKCVGTNRPYINTLKIHRLMEPYSSLYKAILWPRSLLQRVARTSANDDNSAFCILLFTLEKSRKIRKIRLLTCLCLSIWWHRDSLHVNYYLINTLFQEHMNVYTHEPI